MPPTSSDPTEAADDRRARLETAAASPAAVARHDRDGWLDLFSEHGRAEDPVGISPCQKGTHTLRPGSDTDDLTRFWDTFIARNDVRIDVARDVVAGDEVIRDVTLTTTFPGGATVRIPAHLRYHLVRRGGRYHIDHLAAHWDAREPSKQLAQQGFRGKRAVLGMGFALLRNFGLEGSRAYDAGCRGGIRGEGLHRVEALVAALEARDADRVAAAFASADAPVELPVGGATVPAEKLLTALGPYAQLTLDKVLASGWYVSASFTLRRDGATHRGVVFFEFDPVLLRIARARFFWDD